MKKTLTQPVLMKDAGIIAAALAVSAVVFRFLNRFSSVKQCSRDKAMRDQLSEKQIDRMIMDSFPASDPASTY